LFGDGSPSSLGQADQLHGGSGNDIYYHDFSAGGVTIINDLSGGELGNGDTLRLINAIGTLSLRWGDDRSTLFIGSAGEFDDGVATTGMLSNLGAETAGTIENLFVNGTQSTSWLPAVHNGWQQAFG